MEALCFVLSRVSVKLTKQGSKAHLWQDMITLTVMPTKSDSDVIFCLHL